MGAESASDGKAFSAKLEPRESMSMTKIDFREIGSDIGNATRPFEALRLYR